MKEKEERRGDKVKEKKEKRKNIKKGSVKRGEQRRAEETRRRRGEGRGVTSSFNRCKLVRIRIEGSGGRCSTKTQMYRRSIAKWLKRKAVIRVVVR